ncbi:LOW QUALITY PROTEIN: chemerin-like receptor 1 [Anomaloglossus baeobatrachus]|uniref:LOW QUALITY PROTEIN: chemerin-like receptor 1 n=1 Tax=Anomaloglossus baeobatrachus TaxID=238106 RepID=UPI003F508F62
MTTKEFLEKMAITLFSIFFALGIIGNGLVIWIAGFRMKKTISTVWFLHLAIADFLCCASLPVRIAEYSVPYLPNIFCYISMILFNINMTTSVLLLTAMSIDRWVSVMWPFWAKVHRTCNVVRISAAIIWGFSFLFSGLIFYSTGSIFLDLIEWCLIYDFIDDYVKMIKNRVKLLRFVIMCVIPFLIIVTSYVTIFYKIRKSKRSQRSQRSSRIITCVILCFFICWFPYYIWPLTPMYDIPDLLFYIVNTPIITLASLNSCMNPIIYVFMGQDFQHGFLRSIPTSLVRALSDHPNDLCREEEDAENTRSTVV